MKTTVTYAKIPGPDVAQKMHEMTEAGYVPADCVPDGQATFRLSGVRKPLLVPAQEWHDGYTFFGEIDCEHAWGADIQMSTSPNLYAPNRHSLIVTDRCQYCDAMRVKAWYAFVLPQ